MIFGATTEHMLPINKELFIIEAGTTGRVDREPPTEVIVMPSPPMISIIDTSMDTIGPLIATSKSATLVLGKDRSGVILPNVPSCNEGRGTGIPSFTLCFFAAITCPSSCKADIAITPVNIGRHDDDTAETSFSLTMALKTFGFNA